MQTKESKQVRSVSTPALAREQVLRFEVLQAEKGPPISSVN